MSAGRVQSVAVRLVVEREREGDNFEATSSFKVTAFFDIDGRTLKAELPKKLSSETEAHDFLTRCLGATFSIDNLETKPGKRTPAPPFTTSTLQQEASRKLGFAVARTMSLAQKLYEAGKISYMRTDSVNLSDEAVKGANSEIKSAYGEEYIQNRKFKTKSQSAQEAHEAIRPTNFAVHSTGNNYDEQRLYELIWKRAAASQMADAQLEKTTATIGISTATEKLVAHGEVIKFDGFLKVYMESTDDEQEEEAKDMLPPLKIGQALSLNRIYSRESFTRPPARFTEASLVKKLEEMGIGRPSTYAPTISTIQKREYVLKENREGSERPFKELILRNDEVKRQVGRENTGAEKAKLFPTNMAMVVNDYLTDHFEDVLEYSFTANVEERFDKIAHHKEDWQAMIKSFYDPFHHLVEKALEEDRPDTKRELGLDPKTGLPVYVSLGKFGPYAQLGQNSDEEGAEKPKYASLKKGQLLESISLDQALELFKLPREVGLYKDEEIIVADGRYGPYIKYNGKFVSLPKGSDPLSIDIEECISLIKQKEEADAPIYVYQDKPVQKGKGRFGPFIKWDNMFINVNKKYDWDNLSSQDIEELIEDKLKKEREKLIHHWEEEGIRVEKARWGRHNIIQGKIKIELPKTVDVSEMTLEEAQAYIEKNSPKKKSKAKSKS